MNTKRNKIKKGDTMIYEEKRFMAVSEIEKECCTGCCFYDNGNCQLENPNCFNSGIIWVQKEDYMSEISEKAIKLAIEAMRPIPVYSSPCYSVNPFLDYINYQWYNYLFILIFLSLLSNIPRKMQLSYIQLLIFPQ